MQGTVGTLLAAAQKQHFSAADNLRCVFLHQLWLSKVLFFEGNVEKKQPALSKITALFFDKPNGHKLETMSAPHFRELPEPAL